LKQKKGKSKYHAQKYLNHQEEPFKLKQLLEKSYWKNHAASQVVISLKQGKFYNNSNGHAIDGVSWENKLDSETPYSTGFDGKQWTVSLVS
jgi:hypothetical protein